MNEFFSMNGYGAYIWSSFMITAVVMIGELLLLKAQNRSILHRLYRQIRLEKSNNR